MNNGEQLLQQAYDLLENTTPFHYDCGSMCGARCCQGEDAGMWIFPHEYSRFEGKDGFEIRRAKDDSEWDILLCHKPCGRSERPLSCRIFPLFPVLLKREDGSPRIRLIPDPRGGSLCPIIKDKLKITREFRRAVRRAIRLLLQDSDSKAFLRETSEEILEIERFRRLMRG